MAKGPLFPGIKRPGRESDHLPPSRVEVKNNGAIPLLPHTTSWRSSYLIKRRDNLNFKFYANKLDIAYLLLLKHIIISHARIVIASNRLVTKEIVQLKVQFLQQYKTQQGAKIKDKLKERCRIT
jgi:hypothetical protein